MEPFNIRIKIISKYTTLTILPSDSGDYKIIYNGAVLGAVKRNNTAWLALPEDEIIAGDLPLYKIKFGEENPDFQLDEEIVSLIGIEIENETHQSVETK